jgi:hypothetical protein
MHTPAAAAYGLVLAVLGPVPATVSDGIGAP